MTRVAKNLSWMLLLVVVTNYPTTTTATPSICVTARCANYTVLASNGTYELREYKPTNWASCSKTNAIPNPYVPLMAYLRGGNNDSITIPMAYPWLAEVSNSTTPMTSTVFFLLPSGNNSEPSNPNVVLKNYGTRSFHVRPADKADEAEYDTLRNDAGPGNYNNNALFSIMFPNYTEIALLAT